MQISQDCVLLLVCVCFALSYCFGCCVCFHSAVLPITIRERALVQGEQEAQRIERWHVKVYVCIVLICSLMVICAMYISLAVVSSNTRLMVMRVCISCQKNSFCSAISVLKLLSTQNTHTHTGHACAKMWCSNSTLLCDALWHQYSVNHTHTLLQEPVLVLHYSSN
jgi:hypothetical protein